MWSASLSDVVRVNVDKDVRSSAFDHYFARQTEHIINTSIIIPCYGSLPTFFCHLEHEPLAAYPWAASTTAGGHAFTITTSRRSH
jgi:hypothetical protein